MSQTDTYPGAKTNSGLVQFLINNIPLHDSYFELFAGTAKLFRTKRPAAYNIINDIDPEAPALRDKTVLHRGNLSMLAGMDKNDYGSCTWYTCFDAMDHIEMLITIMSMVSTDLVFPGKKFIYLDPPYTFQSRRSGKKYYKHEVDLDYHTRLLHRIQAVDANIMISTKEDPLYNEILKGWRKASFLTTDRQGTYEEIIFMNYDPPEILHQYDFLGKNFTDRQRIQRKIKRMNDKIAMLPGDEKHALLAALVKNNYASAKIFINQF